MSTSFHELLVRYDDLIRKGKAVEVRHELKSFRSFKPPRELLADFANMARRAGLPAFSLRLIEPVLKAHIEHKQPLSAKERASYAASLAAIGSHAEAFGLLEKIKDDKTPEVQLYLGFINIYRWDYEGAIPFLLNYVELPGLSEYQRFVAKLNLAAAYSFTDAIDRLVPLIAQLLETGTKNGWNLLTRDSLLISTQGLISMKMWTEAENAIAKAVEISKQHNLNDFLLRKWSVLLDLHRDGATPSALDRLASLRVDAKARREFETIRECDYHEGVMTKKVQLLKKAFFGTPYPSYRRRLISDTQEWLTLPSAYRWPMQGRHGKLIDLEAGAVADEKLKAGHVSIRALRALSSDFYRPLKIGGLFSAIYPGEHFDPFTSPQRVRKALSRTRNLLDDFAVGLNLACQKNEYFLEAHEPVDLRVRIDYDTEDVSAAMSDEAIKKLKAEFPYKAFTTQQAANVLQFSVPKVREALSAAAEESRVFRIGSGRATLFRFAK